VSYKLSRRVFSLDISSTEKLVLRALADHANDDGSSCYPSILRLARETSLIRKAVQTTLGTLKEKGLVVVVGQSKGGRGKTPEYHLRFPKVDQKSNQEPHLKGVRATPFRKNKGRTSFPERAYDVPVKGVRATPDSVLDSIHDSGGSPGSPPLVSNEKQIGNGVEHTLSHHHQSSHNTPGTKTADDENSDDEGVCSQNPKQVIPESAEECQRRLRASAFQKLKPEYGDRFSDDQIHGTFDEIAARAKTVPVSPNFFVTGFRNEVLKLDMEAERELPKGMFTPEELNKLLTQLGIAPSLWEQFRKVREALGIPIVSRSDEIHVLGELYTVQGQGQSPTEVLKQAVITSSFKLYPVKNKNGDERKSEPIPNAPPQVEPPSDNSGITWDEVQDLVFYAERHRPNASQKALERGWNLVHKKIVRFQNHTGEFRTTTEREDFAKYVVRLKGEKKARDAARIRKNERRRERYKNKAVSHDEYTRADGASDKPQT
jgi:hypothetical protein